MRIKWDELSPKTFEDMVAVLLSHLYPSTQRIDGSGGDGGRDVQFGGRFDLSIFELKSFTGRLTKKRRPQVERSLKNAARLNPIGWTLIVPIDPTPGELDWFEKLRDRYSTIPLTWNGLTWLEKEMASRPEIPKYFLSDINAEVLEILKSINQAQELVVQAGDQRRRLESIEQTLLRIDPHYVYSFSSGPEAEQPLAPGAVMATLKNGVRISVYERYKGALRDRPITVELSLEFGDDDIEIRNSFIHSMEFGSSVHLPARVVKQVLLDAPGGLGESDHLGPIDLTSIPMPSLVHQEAFLEVYDGGHLIGSLPISLKVDHRGSKGFVCRGQDDTTWLQFHLEVDLTERTARMRFGLEPCDILPSRLMPFLRWLRKFGGNNQFVLRWPKMLTSMHRSIEMSFLDDDNYLETVEAICFVQDSTGITFKIPSEFPMSEIGQIIRAKRLLANEVIERTWSNLRLQMEVTNRGEIENLGNAVDSAIRLEQDEWLSIQGNQIPLGRIRKHLVGVLVNAEEVRTAIATGEKMIPLHLQPGSSNIFSEVRIGNVQTALLQS